MAILIPEVFADAVNAKLQHSIRIGSIAFDATSLAPDVLVAGDTVHFPTFDRVAEMNTITKGTAITPEVLSMTDNEATIKQVGGAVRVYDSERAQIKGAVYDNMVQQVSDAIRSKIDADLVTAMDTDAVKKSATASGTAITSDELMAGMALFGDDIDTASFAGIVINSRLFPSLIAMPEFTSTEKTYASMGNGFVKNGLCGYWLGIPVIVCDNNTYDSTTSECKTYFVKTDAVGYIYQQNIKIEEEREAKLLATDIVASSLYATKVIDKDGVVILRKTIAAA